MENSLDWYRKNKEDYFRHHLYCEAFCSVDNCTTSDDDEVYQVIAQVSYDAYMKDENGLGVPKIADFLAIGYEKGKITLDDIRNADKWNILNAVIEDSYKYIKESC